VSAFRRALTWTKFSFGLMREGLSPPESLDGNIRKEVIRRRQERQTRLPHLAGRGGRGGSRKQSAIRKRIVIAHPSSPLGVVSLVSRATYFPNSVCPNHGPQRNPATMLPTTASRQQGLEVAFRSSGFPLVRAFETGASYRV
jgi:hypothetical protein